MFVLAEGDEQVAHVGGQGKYRKPKWIHFWNMGVWRMNLPPRKNSFSGNPSAWKLSLALKSCNRYVALGHRNCFWTSQPKFLHCYPFKFDFYSFHAGIAQLGERQTEDLKVACSIHAHRILCRTPPFDDTILTTREAGPLRG